LVGLAQGLYSVHFQDEIHTAESLTGIRAGEEDLIVVLRDRATVSGTIVNAATGTAVTQFEILTIEGIHGKLSRPNFHRFVAINDTQGRFRVDNVQLGDSTLVVHARGFAPTFETLHLETSEPVDQIIIALQPGASAEGMVFTKAGEAVSDAWLFKEPLPVAMFLDSLVSDMSPNPLRFVDALSDVEGRFIIDTLTVENQSLAAFHPQYGYGEATLSWNSARLSGLRIVLSNTETGSIEVSVASNGVPGEDSVVWVGSLGGGGDMLQRERTDSDGRCILDGIPPGEWSISAVYPCQINSYLRRIVADCEVVAGQTTKISIDFDIPSASLNGTVTLDGESPIGGHAMLTLTRPDESEWYISTWNDNGTFTITDIVPGAGSLTLMAIFEGNRTRSKGFDLEFAENEPKVIEIDLSGGGTLIGVMHGLATTEHGNVVVLRGEHEIAEVTLEWFMAMQSFAAGSGIVAADGSYSVEGLEPGLYTIFAMVTKSLHGPDIFDDVRWATTVVEISDTEESTVDFDMR
jgi:hypothetical protein